jgi:hypothetical protein
MSIVLIIASVTNIAKFSVSDIFLLLLTIVTVYLAVLYIKTLVKNRISEQTDKSLKLVFWGIFFAFIGTVVILFPFQTNLEMGLSIYYLIILVLFSFALLKIYKEFKKQ